MISSVDEYQQELEAWKDKICKETGS